MNAKQLEELMKHMLSLPDIDQNKIESMVMNWDALGGSDGISEKSKDELDSIVEKSGDCWLTDLDEIWDHGSSLYNGKLTLEAKRAARYGLHRILLSPQDIHNALKLIKKDKNRTYKVVSARILARTLYNESIYVQKIIVKSVPYIKSGKSVRKKIELNYFMKYQDEYIVAGLNPHKLYEFYEAQFGREVEKLRDKKR